MHGSWRTTASGSIGLAILVLTAIGNLLTGQPLTAEEAAAIAQGGEAVGVGITPGQVTAAGLILFGIFHFMGLKSARDDQVTSEEAGAKR